MVEIDPYVQDLPSKSWGNNPLFTRKDNIVIDSIFFKVNNLVYITVFLNNYKFYDDRILSVVDFHT